MKALVYVAPERMEIQEIPEPPPAAGEVLLKVGAAGVCGSDLHGFLGHSERRKPGLVMGHEAVATILELHPSVRGWRRGQRVCFNPLLKEDRFRTRNELLDATERELKRVAAAVARRTRRKIGRAHV